MSENTIAVITDDKSDLLEVLVKSPADIAVLKTVEVAGANLEKYGSIAILGGTSEEPCVLPPRARIKVEEQILKGKRVFCEFCRSISDVYCSEPVSTRYERLVFCGPSQGQDGLNTGDLMDDQCNTAMRPYTSICSEGRPILQYINPNAHSRIAVTGETTSKTADRALWIEDGQNLMVCTFRLCNFVKARFAPRKRWEKLIKYITGWLCGVPASLTFPEAAYSMEEYNGQGSFQESLSQCIKNAVEWFTEAGILLDKGREGVLEGVATEIYPDGSQRILRDVRNDCTGEASLAYFMYHMLTGKKEYLDISNNLISFCFDLLQDKSDTHLRGMLRWSEIAWGVCYQDDAARVIIPQLLKCMYTGSGDYMEEALSALDFLVSTTGTDGTRVNRTDNIRLSADEVKRLASTKTGNPSTHYNGFYLGALLLAYKLTGREEYRRVGILGMETIMAAYPETIREHSETQELCRLILPLSWLYWATKDEKHRQWLYRVAGDLKRFSHPSGGFLETDTGYKAHRSAAADNGECSLLSENGDPITDLLYSMNWLPIGFIQAYLVTGDMMFKKLWEDISRFMMSSQIQSGNKLIDGAWARAYDVELREIFGMPKDKGWGPCVIESGWTVAEITAGLCMGLLDEKLKPFYR